MHLIYSFNKFIIQYLREFQYTRFSDNRLRIETQSFSEDRFENLISDAPLVTFIICSFGVIFFSLELQALKTAQTLLLDVLIHICIYLVILTFFRQFGIFCNIGFVKDCS